MKSALFLAMLIFLLASVNVFAEESVEDGLMEQEIMRTLEKLALENPKNLAKDYTQQEVIEIRSEKNGETLTSSL